MRGYVPDLIAFTQGGPYLLAALAFGYLLGSVPFGMVMARVFNLGNLRDVGSGNIGATNVLRTGSKKAAILTLLFDMLKGTIAVLIAVQWGPMTAAVAGFAAFLGHCFPVWLKFKGGKGVATFLGAFLGLHWPTFLAMAATWLVVAFGYRHSLPCSPPPLRRSFSHCSAPMSMSGSRCQWPRCSGGGTARTLPGC